MEMNRYYKLFALVSLLSVCVSCNKAALEDSFKPLSFSAVRENIEEDTRTTLNPSGKIIWDASDKVAILPADRNEINEFSVTPSEDGLSAVISGTVLTPSASGVYYALYPCQACGGLVPSAGEILFDIPPVQTAREGGFDNGIAPMVSRSEGSVLTFSNLASFLYFDLQEDNVTKVILESEDKGEGKGIAATGAKVKLDGSGTPVYCGEPLQTYRTVTLGDGETVLEKGVYYFVLYPNDAENKRLKLDKGFSLKLFDTSGKMAVKSTENPLVVGRSCAKNLGVISGLDFFVTGSLADYDIIDCTGEDIETKGKQILESGLFERINLDYPGLEQMKNLYQQGKYYYAALELRNYYRSREIFNPDANIDDKSQTKASRRIADQALEHRFAVEVSSFYESYKDGVYTYYSFDDGNGGINWKPVKFDTDVGTECYHKMWHKWFTHLAYAYNATGDEKYFNAWVEQYSDWLENYPNPAPATISNQGERAWAWLSISNRIQLQLNYFPYFIQSTNFTPEWLATFLVELDKAVKYGYSQPYSDHKHNFYIFGMNSTVLAGMLMPEFAAAPEWRAGASAALESIVDEAFFSDGVYNELVYNYGQSVIEDMRKSFLISQMNGYTDTFSSNFIAKLRNACSFYADILYPDYTWENLNDSFDTTPSSQKTNLKNYAELFPDVNKLVYMGSEGKSGTIPTDRIIKYPVGGYHMLRTGWNTDASMMVISNNNNVNNAGHSHGDNNTFGLWVRGRRFMPDPGVYTYGDVSGELQKARQWHVMACNHNTLTLDKQNIVASRQRGQCLKSESTADYDMIVCQNASYSNLTHRRTFFQMKEGYYVIVDEAFGNAAGIVNVGFHFLPEFVTDDYSASNSYGIHSTFTDGNNLLARTFSETSTEFSVEDQGDDWMSFSLNVRSLRKYYRINVRKYSDRYPRFITVLLPCADATPSKHSVSASFTDGGFSASGASLQVTVDGVTHNLSYSLQ